MNAKRHRKMVDKVAEYVSVACPSIGIYGDTLEPNLDGEIERAGHFDFGSIVLDRDFVMVKLEDLYHVVKALEERQRRG